MGVLVVRDELSWNPDDGVEVELARAWFNDMIAFGLVASTPDGRRVEKFDPSAETIVMSDPAQPSAEA